MVVVPDASLRDSTAFALEAEGYAVIAVPWLKSLEDLPGWATISGAVVDDKALGFYEGDWMAFPIPAIALMIDGFNPRARWPDHGAVILKPLLGRSLVEVVEDRISAITPTPLPSPT
ncbi:hypothetical protein KEU06_15100 [Pseudaminobacter sp. 19-2017]|uniref:Uncharacterized protein n=1 Tax=Pseudaminobacter soli (ex Zhang et al. 2022) TaxID=2831468 RepID=A0A942I3H2_9HYPH|nr:hypothetical protein [Pseudaminobacter soli]MBS3649939.1 hypothetical protein [Pseudaminobacter soli]